MAALNLTVIGRNTRFFFFLFVFLLLLALLTYSQVEEVRTLNLG